MSDAKALDVRFYHMQVRGLDQTLPALLNKALKGGHRIVIRVANDAEAERLNAHLWNYDPASFIPHGTKKDGYAELQPIWIAAEDENPNDAGVLILTDGVQVNDFSSYSMVCEMFDGRDDRAVDAARSRWKVYKEAGHQVTYWQQNEKGGWDKKA